MERDDEWLLRDLQEVKHIFGDKWTVPVLVALAGGPLRRSEILVMVRSYSIEDNSSGKTAVLHDSILTRALRKMVADGLVARHELPDTFPRHVRYALLPDAADFLARVRHVVGWSRGNRYTAAHDDSTQRLHNVGSADCDDEGCHLRERLICNHG